LLDTPEERSLVYTNNKYISSTSKERIKIIYTFDSDLMCAEVIISRGLSPA
jgi:hypothetical protein